MNIHILTENTIYKRGFLAEHGLSLLIEHNDKTFLFDLGQTDVYLKNAKKLHLNLKKLDGIILSHGHYDHCGGLEFFPGFVETLKEEGQNLKGVEAYDFPPLYVGEGAFRPKYHDKENGLVSIGIDWKRDNYKGNIIDVKDRYHICDGFTLLSKIEYVTEFEEAPYGFYYEEKEKENQKKHLCQDYMEDEQILVVETKKGLCIFAGCSHMGIINCIKRVQKEFPGKRIHSILAGMHLKNVSKTRLDQTIEELKNLEFDYLIPVHCTGMEAIVRMKEALGERCLFAEAGKNFVL